MEIRESLPTIQQCNNSNSTRLYTFPEHAEIDSEKFNFYSIVYHFLFEQMVSVTFFCWVFISLQTWILSDQLSCSSLFTTEEYKFKRLFLYKIRDSCFEFLSKSITKNSEKMSFFFAQLAASKYSLTHTTQHTPKGLNYIQWTLNIHLRLLHSFLLECVSLKHQQSRNRLGLGGTNFPIFKSVKYK